MLDNSLVASVRDLGIGLRFLKSLSLSCCGLIDIDGIGVLTGLQDLCLSDNSIVDVTPLAMHENLQVSTVNFFFLIIISLILQSLSLHRILI